MKKHKTQKAFALSLAMALGMLLPTTTHAQSDGFFRGGSNYSNRDGTYNLNIQTFGSGISDNYGLNNQTFGSGIGDGYNLNNQTFGQEAPLGSGLIIMLAAGGAYALKKSKEQNN